MRCTCKVPLKKKKKSSFPSRCSNQFYGVKVSHVKTSSDYISFNLIHSKAAYKLSHCSETWHCRVDILILNNFWNKILQLTCCMVIEWIFWMCKCFVLITVNKSSVHFLYYILGSQVSWSLFQLTLRLRKATINRTSELQGRCPNNHSTTMLTLSIIQHLKTDLLINENIFHFYIQRHLLNWASRFNPK